MNYYTEKELEYFELIASNPYLDPLNLGIPHYDMFLLINERRLKESGILETLKDCWRES